MKFAFVSSTVPPAWSGQSVVIYRLLKDLDPHDYCLIVQDYGKKSPSKSFSCEKLAGRYYHLPAWLQLKRGWRFSIVKWLNILVRALQIARILKREKCEAVVASTGDLFDMPAAYLACRLAQVKFYPYLFDYYSHKAIGKASAFALRVEPVMLKKASGIIVPNEFLRDDLQRRYGLRSTVVHNPCELRDYETAEISRNTIAKNGEINIVYTGSIYEAHIGAFRNLIASMELLKHWKIKLHVYTDQSSDELEQYGIRGRVELHPPLSISAVPGVQQQATLLFLPLSFDSPYPEVIRTSAPGKTGEYLAAGRPVLVHAPRESFLAWYFHRYECGLVVDEGNPEKLGRAIELLMTDQGLQRRLVTNAKERARADFSVQASRAAFAELLGLKLLLTKEVAATK